MKPLPDSLLELARGHFPGGSAAEFAVEPVVRGGSDRTFYRLRAPGGSSLIAVVYTGQRAENRHYVAIARFLAEAGVRVPAVYFHDPERGLIFMEDLGEVDLWHWRDAPWDERRRLYESAIDQAVRLHGEATRRLPSAQIELQKEFSEQLYLWEQNYFVEHGLAGVFGLPVAEARALASGAGLAAMARRLAALPRVLVHRDFQSQNILITPGGACLIDFQGMRPGLPHYDVASLLYDPYVALHPRERNDLVAAYAVKAAAAGVPLEGDFAEILDLCAVQRLMQAMGAYGFLGLRQGKPQFLGHVPAAQRALRQVLPRVEGTGPLQDFLARARA